MKTYKGEITELKDKQALLITTNYQGKHSKGNALLGMKIAGAIYGQAKGPMGKCYGIITKDIRKKKHPSVPSDFIIEQIGEFYEFAKRFWNIDFLIPYSGNGIYLNGYTPKEMAEMFLAFKIPENLVFEEEFSKLLK